MSISNYKRRTSQNPYSPSFSSFTIYRTAMSKPSLFSPRRTMSAVDTMEHNTGPNKLKRCASSSSSSHNFHDSESSILNSSNIGQTSGVLTSLYDSGRIAISNIMHSQLNDHTTNSKHEIDYKETSFTPSKRTKLEKTRPLQSNNDDGSNVLKFSKDPFGWNKWETTPIGGPNDQDDSKPVQYGTRFMRRKKSKRENINDAKMILRGRSDEVSYLKQIFNGEYTLPKVIEDERQQQLKLLERDRKTGQRHNKFKKTVIDLTERIKNVLLDNKQSLLLKQKKEEDDLIFIKEKKLTPLERKHKEFYNENLKLDQTLLNFEKEFKNYKQLVEERKKIQDLIRKKREEELTKKQALKKLIPELDASKIALVKKALSRNDNNMVMNKDNLEIRVRDLKTLAPKRWLNDTIIEYFMKSIEKKTERTIAFNSFFYTSLSERGYQGVRRWMKRKKVKIGELDKIFVPINLNQSHWALCLINIPDKTISYVDSLSNGPSAMSFAILSDLKNYVVQESGKMMGEDFEFMHLVCPQQPNGFDCGIYVCMNALYLSKDSALTFDHKDAVRMRIYIAHLILSDSTK
ncbi:hypothetical protein KAFR_0B01650 [Kazachstania africana CBS 2517]|uniref:Ubiquitin-like protease family profile domain-containing protein n=1 Tax=Kazachstania africana (strain ATCC 22294 / BCRC 22015 / CBS 2517 / CECT 1963 / NBRC 1671 / NRRL Y-8276) TaxID=1071382 RepID=H2AQ14_KAZAF|nr:hypothetical protein KAFR_0B01650 [Kazachstania africana CBS 2517]CCF56464.1 hypothetical protein KAFR_0B01650 [Kazachstania africana CBS 2517]